MNLTMRQLPRSVGTIYRSSYSRFYYGLRVYLHGNRQLLHLAVMLRGLLVLGPFRAALVRYYQTFGANRPFTTDLTGVFPCLNVNGIVEQIEQFGYARVDNLQEKHVEQILAYCEANKQMRCRNPHKDCKAVDGISRDAKILEIARRYLGGEPILYLTELAWWVPRLEDRANFLSSDYVKATENKYDHGFHYDIHDVKSLTLFVYLTDIVDMDSCPHTLIEGTHKRKTFKELLSRNIDEKVAQKKFGHRVRVILGGKGTAFLEDTTSFHKVVDGTKSRLLLMITYVLRRSVPPDIPR